LQTHSFPTRRSSDLIPAAFADVALALRRLNDFRPHARARRLVADFTSALSGNHFISPAKKGKSSSAYGVTQKNASAELSKPISNARHSLRRAPRDVGARAVVRNHPGDVQEVPTAERGIAIDIDTIGDYEREIAGKLSG
jgi:hypothetical protein